VPPVLLEECLLRFLYLHFNLFAISADLADRFLLLGNLDLISLAVISLLTIVWLGSSRHLTEYC
jgi:hypothetical protein